MNIIAAETTLTFVIMVHIITIDKDSDTPVFRIEGEYDSDLMASFGKIFTSILNHGDGGYINITMVKKLHPLGLLVNRSSENVSRALIEEISKIKPSVSEADYRIICQNQDEEVHVEVDPVPWGLDPYAAADGHVYTPDLVAHFQEDKGTEIKYTADQIHPVKRTEHNFDATEVCDMEISNSLESVGIDQESKSKVHDKLENEIKEIIENCVHDLREIKGLGIPKRMDLDAAEKTAKCTMDTAMPSCKTRLHHSKSVSESLNNSRSQPLQQWKSVSISVPKEIKLNPCWEVKDWPGTNGKLVQVDGEGSVSENIDQKNDTDESEYFLPQLDGLFERVSYAEQSPSLNRTITYNVNQQQRIGLANSGTGKSWVPFASVDFVYLNTNFFSSCKPVLSEGSHGELYLSGYTTFEYDIDCSSVSKIIFEKTFIDPAGNWTFVYEGISKTYHKENMDIQLSVRPISKTHGITLYLAGKSHCPVQQGTVSTYCRTTNRGIPTSVTTYLYLQLFVETGPDISIICFK